MSFSLGSKAVKSSLGLGIEDREAQIRNIPQWGHNMVVTAFDGTERIFSQLLVNKSSQTTTYHQHTAFPGIGIDKELTIVVHDGR